LQYNWIHPGVDRYMAACEEVKESLISWGIMAQRILVTGIPVSPKIEVEMDRGHIISLVYKIHKAASFLNWKGLHVLCMEHRKNDNLTVELRLFFPL